jgi:hypothetical protein
MKMTQCLATAVNGQSRMRDYAGFLLTLYSIGTVLEDDIRLWFAAE